MLPTEEFFDVVNARDEPIGRASRREVHARGLWHRAVHIFVFDQAGRIFLQKRSMTKDSSPGLWTLSCSGHVDAGEEYDFAAQRELGEELGLILAAPPERWLRLNACEILGWEFSWIYRMKSDGPFTLHPEEIECGVWKSVDEINASIATEPEIYCPAFRWVWSQVGL